MRHVVVTAERSGTWWVLECAEAGAVSQCRRLRQAADEMRDAIAYQLRVEPDSFEIDVVPTLPTVAAEELAAAAEQRELAQRANAAAAAHARSAARSLADTGLSVREIGQLLHVSHQRAAQLLAR